MTTHLNADHSVFEAEGVKVFIIELLQINYML